MILIILDVLCNWLWRFVRLECFYDAMTVKAIFIFFPFSFIQRGHSDNLSQEELDDILRMNLDQKRPSFTRHFDYWSNAGHSKALKIKMACTITKHSGFQEKSSRFCFMAFYFWLLFANIYLKILCPSSRSFVFPDDFQQRENICTKLKNIHPRKKTSIAFYSTKKVLL